MNTPTKIRFLRLRNRVLNRFKAIKKVVRHTKSKQITKSPKRTLRVVPKTHIRTRSSPVTSPKSSPVKFGSRTAAALVGHRRLFLRNRRLMMAYALPAIACF